MAKFVKAPVSHLRKILNNHFKYRKKKKDENTHFYRRLSDDKNLLQTGLPTGSENKA